MVLMRKEDKTIRDYAISRERAAGESFFYRAFVLELNNV